MNIKSLKEAFRTISNSAAPDLTSKKRKIARSLVPKHSCGNINLQLGRFVTEDDIEKRRKKVCDYNFAD